MRISGDWLRRQIAICLVLFLAVPFAEAATAQPQPPLPGPQAEGVSSLPAQSENSNRATSKSAVDTEQSASFPAAPNAARAQTIDRNQQSGASLSAPEQQQNGTSGPVGAAAAPFEKTTGVAASRPAGAAIAPAKQRRARSILIKVGVLLGAGIAIGTVVALSSASPSRPH